MRRTRTTVPSECNPAVLVPLLRADRWLDTEDDIPGRPVSLHVRSG